MADSTTKKVLGWGNCSVTEEKSSTTYNDIADGTASLDVEEGEEQEALIEGGTREGYKRKADKYNLTYNRRLGSESEVTPGFTEDAGDVTVTPENVGAIGVKLKNCSKHVALKYDTTDGLVAVYTWSTNGQTDSEGNLTDVEMFKKTASTTT